MACTESVRLNNYSRESKIIASEIILPYQHCGSTVEEHMNTVTAGTDEIPWDLRPVPDRIVAVGDIHGDIRALASILLDRDLIDRRGQWTGDDCHLILVGDVMRRHDDSRLLMEFILRLESESKLDGGEVHPLLGNQDVAVRYRNGRLQPLDQFFRPWTGSGPVRDEFPAMIRYASWLRRRNAILRVGETVFVHAGLGDWAMRHRPGEVNSTIRTWIAHWHGLEIEPNRKTSWMVGGSHERYGPPKCTGPLWSRAFKPPRTKKGRAVPRPDSLSLDEVEDLLDTYRAERMVIGHNPVDRKKWITVHPYYGSMVCMIDTAISRKSGKLSCIELDQNGVTPHLIKPSKHANKVRKAEKLRVSEYGSIIPWYDQDLCREEYSGVLPNSSGSSLEVDGNIASSYPFLIEI